MKIASARDLTVYKKSYALGMRIFEVTKRFPPEERYALTGQLRRSGRSPCRSLREAWAKRRYRAHFISKLTDADGENGETDTSLDFAHDCGYITDDEHEEMTAECAEIGRMLGAKIKSPDKYLKKEWCTRVCDAPLKVERQEHNRFRFWGEISELEGRVLRVITLDDKKTIHNAFPDRRFKR